MESGHVTDLPTLRTIIGCRFPLSIINFSFSVAFSSFSLLFSASKTMESLVEQNDLRWFAAVTYLLCWRDGRRVRVRLLGGLDRKEMD